MQDKKNSPKQMLERLSMPTPAFWKRIRNRSLAMFILLGSLSAGNMEMAEGHSIAFDLPDQLATIISYISTGCAFVWFISNFAVQGTVTEPTNKN